MKNKAFILKPLTTIQLTCLCLIWCCWFAVPTQAQHYYRAERYRVEQGLPTNLTKSILQDQKGFVWIASDAGVIRYDGQNFFHFNQVLPSNYTKHIMQRKNGDILVAHDKGVSKIINIPDSVIFQDFLNATNDAKAGTITPPKFVFEDSQQRLWIGEDQTISKYENKRLKRYDFSNAHLTTSWNRSFLITETTNGDIYATSQRGGVFWYNPQQDVFLPVEMPNNLFSVVSALVSIGNKLWVGTENGIYEIVLTAQGKAENVRLIFNQKDISFLRATPHNTVLIGTWNDGLHIANLGESGVSIQKVTTLDYKVINDAVADHDHHFWVSSDQGIAFLHRPFFANLSLPSERNYLLHIDKGNDQNLYVTEGAVVNSIDLNSTQVNAQLWRSAQIGAKDMLAVVKNQHGLWLGTSDAVLYCINGQRTDTLNLRAYMNKIVFMHRDQQENIWLCQPDYKRIVKVSPDRKVSVYDEKKGIKSICFVIRHDAQGNLYAGGNAFDAYLYRYDEAQDRFINISTPIKDNTALVDEELRTEDIVIDYQGKIWLCGSFGLWQYGKDATKNIPLPSNTEVKALSASNNGSIWLGTNVGLMEYLPNGELLLFDESNGLPSKTIAQRSILFDEQERVWIGTASGLAYSQQTYRKVSVTPTPIFLHIESNKQKIHFGSDSAYVLEPNSYLKLFFASLSFPSEKIQYQYRLLHKGTETWQSTQNELLFPQINSGTYNLEIRARQQGSFEWSEPLRLRFSVDTPLILRWWALLLYALGIVGMVALAVQFYTRNLVKEKEKLELMVVQRTSEIHLQKEEIEKRNGELDQKSGALEKQNKNVMASIRYAKRIQDAMLPTPQKFETLFPDSFVFYKPRDVVSGDFYWCAESNLFLSKVLAKQMVAAVDCTGHGVPGAFMSLVANSLLNDIVKSKGMEHPEQMLAELHQQIQTVLQQKQTENIDGLDIALCVVDKANKKLEFAGAKNSLYVYRNNALEEVKADKVSIGGWRTADKLQFTRHTIELQQGINTFYIFSDGYKDQFGGTDYRRFSSKRFKENLSQIASLSMADQKQQLYETFMSWKGTNTQEDDVLVIGFNIHV